MQQVVDGVTVSNGLEWSPDGRLAYYNDTATHRVDVFDYDRDAGLTGRRTFADLGDAMPDGLTVDAEGGVWTALYDGGAVRRYAPDGTLDLVVEVRPRRSPPARSAAPTSTSCSSPPRGRALGPTKSRWRARCSAWARASPAAGSRVRGLRQGRGVILTGMPAATEAAARLRAYELMQVAQSAARETAVRDLVALEAQARLHGWREAELVAAAGLTMSVLVRPERDQAAAATDSLVARARSHGAPHLLALALSLRAVAAAGRDDGEALLADAASALAIVEEDSLPALDRCAVLLICAAGYNTLRLWELVTELLDRASTLAPLCESPVQEPAVAANRVLVRLEWAVSLLETGATEDAWDQLDARRRRGAAGAGERRPAAVVAPRRARLP